jgi:hypothetical protein
MDVMASYRTNTSVLESWKRELLEQNKLFCSARRRLLRPKRYLFREQNNLFCHGIHASSECRECVFSPEEEGDEHKSHELNEW